MDLGLSISNSETLVQYTKCITMFTAPGIPKRSDIKVLASSNITIIRGFYEKPEIDLNRCNFSSKTFNILLYQYRIVCGNIPCIYWNRMSVRILVSYFPSYVKTLPRFLKILRLLETLYLQFISRTLGFFSC